MRKPNEFMSTLAATGDVMNTLAGGISEPVAKVVSLESAQQIKIKVPGVDVNALSIEINNNRLTVFQLMELTTANQPVQVPRIIYSTILPHYINVNGIEASSADNRLIVTLPFNERANGYRRKVNIRNT